MAATHHAGRELRLLHGFRPEDAQNCPQTCLSCASVVTTAVVAEDRHHRRLSESRGAGRHFIYFTDFEASYKLPKTGGPRAGRLADSAREGTRRRRERCIRRGVRVRDLRTPSIASARSSPDPTTPVELARGAYVTSTCGRWDATLLARRDAADPRTAAAGTRVRSKSQQDSVVCDHGEGGHQLPLVLAVDATNIYYTNWGVTGTTTPVTRKIEERIRRDHGLDVPVLLRTQGAAGEARDPQPVRQEPQGHGDAPRHISGGHAGSSRPSQTRRAGTCRRTSSTSSAARSTSTARTATAGSKLTNAFFEKQLGVVATTRNWRTVTTLAELREFLIVESLSLPARRPSPT